MGQFDPGGLRVLLRIEPTGWSMTGSATPRRQPASCAMLADTLTRDADSIEEQGAGVANRGGGTKLSPGPGNQVPVGVHKLEGGQACRAGHEPARSPVIDDLLVEDRGDNVGYAGLNLEHGHRAGSREILDPRGNQAEHVRLSSKPACHVNTSLLPDFRSLILAAARPVPDAPRVS
jgi:hypothetical protein